MSMPIKRIFIYLFKFKQNKMNKKDRKKKKIQKKKSGNQQYFKRLINISGNCITHL